MAKSKEELIYDIKNNLVDSNTGKITGETVKARLLDMVDAMAESAGKGGNMEYWRISDKDAFLEGGELLFAFVLLIRVEQNENAAVYSLSMVNNCFDFLTAIAFDRSVKLLAGGNMLTVDEIITMMEQEMGVSWDSLGLTPMTEDQFYAI